MSDDVCSGYAVWLTIVRFSGSSVVYIGRPIYYLGPRKS
jgi:hypothetical protein